MDLYNVFGVINTIFILFSLLGVFSQLRTIWLRKQQASTQHSPAELLSLNQFSVSFLAYFSFFIYGYSIEPFNHYIVWPRLIATVLVGLILFEIWKDRRTVSASACFGIGSLIFIVGVLGCVFSVSEGGRFTDESKTLSSSLIVVITLLIAQGYFHQIRLVIRSRKTGAIDLKMSQYILLMDISTIAFALSMGIAHGWPLLLLATVSGITKLVIMYLFRWVRLNEAKHYAA